MKPIVVLLRFIIPLAVLYTIGYFVAGFSALSFTWLFWLALLITIGNWVVFRVFKGRLHTKGKFVLYFLVATVLIFTMTQGIKGGEVPLGGAILAAVIISLLQTLIPDVNVIRR